MRARNFNSKFSITANLEVSLAVFIQRMKTITRYKGSLLFDMMIPTLFALFPILMGSAIAGSADNAAENFGITSGSDQYILYMIIGANVFQMTNGAINNFGFFLRKEQLQGTLESIYLAPVSQGYILLGTAFYTIIRALLNFFLSLLLASVIFGINPFQGNWLHAILYLIVGLVPIYGLSFGIGALILKFKDNVSLQTMITWGFSTLMGIFFPIVLFPKWLLFLAYIFPPTWQNSAVKGAITGSNYIIEELWLANLAVIIAMGLIYPIIGMKIFSRTERSLRRKTGLGIF